MRKSLALTLILAVLSVSGVCLAQSLVNGAKDKVTFAETVIYGDKRVADGITVNTKTHYDYHLFWDTVYTVGAEPRTETQFVFSPVQLHQNPPIEYRGVHFEPKRFPSDRELSGEQTGISLAYKELFEEIPNGGGATRIVRFKDYLDYYPLHVWLEFPGFLLGWDDIDLIIEGIPEPGSVTYIIRAFQDFFKIPVLENERVEISIHKTQDGQISGMGFGSAQSESFNTVTKSVIAENACYFTFNSHTNEGNIIDTSQISGGYGIYRLPYERDESGKTQILADDLKMAYALDPATKLVDLSLNQEQTKLLLHAIKNGRYTLTVIDISSMMALQELDVFRLPESIKDCAIYDGGEFLVIVSFENTAVVSKSESGSYAVDFVTELALQQNLKLLFEPGVSMSYDGRRLAVSGFAADHMLNCSFYLAVCQEEGLAFYGVYKSSLDTGGEQNRYYSRCLPVDYEPLHVEFGNWQD